MTLLSLWVGRLSSTLSTAATKVFFSGFFWQLFQLLSSSSNHIHFYLFNAESTIQYVLCGLGDAFGVFAGLVLLDFCTKRIRRRRNQEDGINEPSSIFNPSLFFLLFGSFCSGFAWQPLTNFTHTIDNSYLNFNLAMLFVGGFCFQIFFTGMLVSRLLWGLIFGGGGLCTRKNNIKEIICTIDKPESATPFLSDEGEGETLPAVGEKRVANHSQTKTLIIKDLTLAISVGVGAAFFVGTDTTEPPLGYHHNWLQPVVGERYASNWRDCWKAGLSVFLGFTSCQLVIVNFIVPKGYNWTDE